MIAGQISMCVLVRRIFRMNIGVRGFGGVNLKFEIQYTKKPLTKGEEKMYGAQSRPWPV